MTDQVEAAKVEETAKAEEPAKNPLEKSVTFTVSAAALDAGVAAELKKYAKKAKMPGFRPGHVPFATVQAMYGQQAYGDVMNRLVSDAYVAAIREAKLDVAGAPTIKPEETKPGEDLKFTATVECVPEFELAKLEDVEVKRFVCPVTDAEVQKTIDVMVKQRVTYEEEAGRRAAAEDCLTCNFKGTKDGVAFEGGSAENFRFVLGQGRMLPEFETAATGMAAGEKKTFELTFPENYSSKDLAGKTVQFDIEVTKVEKPVYPAVDDEFAKGLGLKDAEQVRTEVTKNVNMQVKGMLRNRQQKAVFDKLCEINPIPVPKAPVYEEQQRLRQGMTAQMQQYTGSKKVRELPLEIFAEQAEQRVRFQFIAGKMIDAEKLMATEDEARALATELSAVYEKPEEMVKYLMSDAQQHAALLNQATENKIVEYVLSKAKVTEEQLNFDDLMAGK